VEIRESTNLLDDSELAKALINTASHGNLILDPQVEFNQSQIRKVKEFYNDYFDKVAHATEVKALAKEVQEGLVEQANSIDKCLAQSEQYPFIRALSPILAELQELKSKPYTWFMSELTSDEDKWFDFKEKTIDPIFKFMRGPQKSSFDAAKQLLATQKPNLEYIQSQTGEAAHQQITEALVSPDIYKGAAIQQLKANTDSLSNELNDLLLKEREAAIGSIESLKDKLTGFAEYQALDTDKQQQLASAFDVAIGKLNGQNLIAMLRDEVRRFEEQSYSSLVQQLMTWNQPAPEPKKPDYKKTESTKPQPEPSGEGYNEHPISAYGIEEPKAKPVPPQTVSAKNVKVDFHKPWLASEQDVEQYLEEYKKSLLAAINDGKHIQL
jgi:hypothetical protein